MEQNKTLSTPLNRITLLDALRGFALLGVILMHMLQQFSIFSSPDLRQPLFPEMDQTVQWIGQNIIMGRFINIFAFLFGLSFFIQLDRASKKGVDFRGRFIWRMVVMLFIGLVGNIFYSGEIITLYAVFGALLVPLFRVKSWVLMTISLLLLLGTPRVIQVSYNTLVKTEQAEQKNATQTQAAKDAARDTKPSFLNSAKHNFTAGLQGKLNYQFGLFGRGYITFALFLAGLVVGRIRFFEKEQPVRKLLTLFIGFLCVVFLTEIIAGMFPGINYRSLVSGQAENLASGLALMSLNDVKIVAFSGAIVMAFALLYQHKNWSKYLDVFSPYGRMGLTNYEMQGVIGCFMFSMWAFGLYFQSLGTTELFLLGIVIYLLQLAFSSYWLKKHLYGPLEWFLRSATYLKAQPFRKKK
ncbi:MAG TPA: DUF418 domain-containing protein [Candidatus Sphingobacterium stercoripullorum]|uniref:DUF418 domain-containing protein n=1 Tax=Candidatus Sphingobacterium stercoripullorum TaxID=2838759 RepID=A0A9D1W9E2_9SPHI|nr:DUF418 domain-containing protein [Candidatus Sphingobacterium stercoripullorum]HLR49122.1 DUF418 domain-containing protein [Candidatus Sphingobacterium stercoripullorum]